MNGHDALHRQFDSAFPLSYGVPCPALLTRTARAVSQLKSMGRRQAPFLGNIQLAKARSSRNEQHDKPLADSFKSEQQMSHMCEDGNKTCQTSKDILSEFWDSQHQFWDDAKDPLPFWGVSEDELEALPHSQVSLTPVVQHKNLIAVQPLSQSLIQGPPLPTPAPPCGTQHGAQ